MQSVGYSAYSPQFSSTNRTLQRSPGKTALTATKKLPASPQPKFSGFGDWIEKVASKHALAATFGCRPISVNNEIISPEDGPRVNDTTFDFTDFQKGMLLDVNFAKSKFPYGANFEEAVIGGSNFSECSLRGGNFENTVAHGANFSQAILPGANFKQSQFTTLNRVSDFIAIFKDKKDSLLSVFGELPSFFASFLPGNRAETPARASFHQALLAGADFSDAKAQGADFSYAQLPGADFSRADARGADFSNSQAQLADFTEANLENTNFTGARILGAKFQDARLAGAKINLLDALERELHSGTDGATAYINLGELLHSTALKLNIHNPETAKQIHALFEARNKHQITQSQLEDSFRLHLATGEKKRLPVPQMLPYAFDRVYNELLG